MYTALIADNRRTRLLVQPLGTSDLKSAMSRADDLSKGHESHHVVHVCVTDEWGDLHSVAARMICSTRWLCDYPVH